MYLLRDIGKDNVGYYLLLRLTVVWLNCLYNTPYGFVQLIFYAHREENYYFKCQKNKNKKYILLMKELFLTEILYRRIILLFL